MNKLIPWLLPLSLFSFNLLAETLPNIDANDSINIPEIQVKNGGAYSIKLSKVPNGAIPPEFSLDSAIPTTATQNNPNAIYYPILKSAIVNNVDAWYFAYSLKWHSYVTCVSMK